MEICGSLRPFTDHPPASLLQENLRKSQTKHCDEVATSARNVPLSWKHCCVASLGCWWWESSENVVCQDCTWGISAYDMIYHKVLLQVNLQSVYIIPMKYSYHEPESLQLFKHRVFLLRKNVAPAWDSMDSISRVMGPTTTTKLWDPDILPIPLDSSISCQNSWKL